MSINHIYISRFNRLIFLLFLPKVYKNSLKSLKKGGFCDMIRIVKRKLAVEKELLSKIEWENDLVKYTKIILPIK